MPIPAPWVAQDVSLGILVGAAGSLVFWNCKTVLTGIGSIVQGTRA